MKNGSHAKTATETCLQDVRLSSSSASNFFIVLKEGFLLKSSRPTDKDTQENDRCSKNFYKISEDAHKILVLFTH